MNDHQITYIDVGMLHTHPKNPRKNLGDLTELSASISLSGIMQNLTVVPKPDGPAGHYYVVIGNRRHGASQKAGLAQVPCVISDMDEKAQIRTMMVENMNRSDLSILEQAEGFQMMLDLGDSASAIATQTGFSKSTVRHRLKLLDFDRDKLQKSVNRGATLQDFIAIEAIKDPEQKSALLDAIGTPNFNYALKQAKESEKTAEYRASIIAALSAFATEIDDGNTAELNRVTSYSFYNKTQFEPPEDAGKRKYFYTVSTYFAYLYAEPTAQEKRDDAVQAEANTKKHERMQQLNQLAQRCFQLRLDFVKDFADQKKQVPLITEMAVQSMLLTSWGFRFDGSLFLDLLGLEPDADGEFDVSMLLGPIAKNPERVLLAASYANMGDTPGKTHHRYDGAFQENEALDMVYGFLERLGYAPSDDELAYRNGTHALFGTDSQEVKPAA